MLTQSSLYKRGGENPDALPRGHFQTIQLLLLFLIDKIQKETAA
jgi:hypothetical protein